MVEKRVRGSDPNEIIIIWANGNLIVFVKRTVSGKRITWGPGPEEALREWLRPVTTSEN